LRTIGIFIIASCLWLACSQPAQPRNLEECHRYLDTALDAEGIAAIKELLHDDLILEHMGLGLYLRNEWLHGQRNKPLLNYFYRLGINHPDEMSGLILDSYWHYLNKLPYDVKNEVNKIISYYKEGQAIEDSAFQALVSHNKPCRYLDTQAPVAAVPDLPGDVLYMSDHLSHKSGYIIRTIASRESINEPFCDLPFIDTVTLKPSLIRIKGIDTIHSVISRNDTLFISGVWNNACRIMLWASGKHRVLGTDIRNGSKLDSNGWVKLGFYNNELIALQKNGVFVFRQNSWERLVSYSLEQFYVSRNYRRSFTPAEVPDNLRFLILRHYNMLVPVIQIRYQQQNCSQ
jgi:hypothetical protein